MAATGGGCISLATARVQLTAPLCAETLAGKNLGKDRAGPECDD